jgi:DASS family divalent anion:Na+ symporter
VILPIARSIAELYKSAPGATALRLGAFLMAAVYQSVCVSAAMFFTGQASNPLVAQMAGQQGYSVTWASWLVASCVPGLLSIALVPWVTMKIYPPEIQHTPEAAQFASDELHKMGPMSRDERILAVVFVSVCGLWVTSSWHHMDITLTALLGSMALLLTGVLKWEDVLQERTGWDIFLWYGGLVRLGKALNDTGVTRVFADGVGQWFTALEWLPMLLLTLVVYFYAHYGFASITAHALAMYPAFLALLLAKGAPIGLSVYSLAIFGNLCACLTNFGTTPAPMFFAQGYVPFGTWWKIGAVMSILHLAIWGTVGFAWWKALGLW